MKIGDKIQNNFFFDKIASETEKHAIIQKITE